MQHSWSMDGCYANWTLTLTMDPVYDSAITEVPVSAFQPVADNFDMAVNRYELNRDMERLGPSILRRLK